MTSAVEQHIFIVIASLMMIGGTESIAINQEHLNQEHSVSSTPILNSIALCARYSDIFLVVLSLRSCKLTR